MGRTSTKCASASLCLDELRSRCWHGFAVNAKHPHDLMTPKLFPLNGLLFKSCWWSFIIPSISRTPLISKTRNQVYYSCFKLFGNLAWVVCQWVWICLSFKVAQSQKCLFTKSHSRIVIHVKTLPNTLWLNKLQLSAEQRHLAHISMQRKESGLRYVVL